MALLVCKNIHVGKRSSQYSFYAAYINHGYYSAVQSKLFIATGASCRKRKMKIKLSRYAFSPEHTKVTYSMHNSPSTRRQSIVGKVSMPSYFRYWDQVTLLRMGSFRIVWYGNLYRLDGLEYIVGNTNNSWHYQNQ